MDQLWLDCAQGPATCAELSAPRENNRTCQPGCYCQPGTLLLVSGPPPGLLGAWGPWMAGQGQAGPGWMQRQGDPAELRGEH